MGNEFGSFSSTIYKSEIKIAEFCTTNIKYKTVSSLSNNIKQVL
jgi:hypothetical protein